MLCKYSLTLLAPPPSLSPEESGEHFLEASFGFFIYIFIKISIHARKCKRQCKYLGPCGRKVSGGVFTLVLFSRSVFSFFPLPGMRPRISELNFYPGPTEPESSSMYIMLLTLQWHICPIIQKNFKWLKKKNGGDTHSRQFLEYICICATTSSLFVWCHGFHRAVRLMLNGRVAHVPISMDVIVLTHTA